MQGMLPMTTTIKSAEESVAWLIDETNRVHLDCVGDPWCYELTTQVDNIGVTVTETSKTLRINPCWLRFVVESGDFKVCVADEIVAWYLIQDLTCNI